MASQSHVERLDAQITLLQQAREDAELLERIFLELGPYESEGLTLSSETRRLLGHRFGFDDSE